VVDLVEHILPMLECRVVDLVVANLVNLELEHLVHNLHQLFMEHLLGMVIMVDQEHGGILVIID
tara:strand:+ start:253 stop:444 length:192 start_codon:yes stop_codon:yes gene_type:complete